MISNRMFAEDGATEDFEALREEWNRPDGVIPLNEGGLNKIKGVDNLAESQHLMNHMNFMLSMMQRTSGVNDSMLGFGGVNERSAAQQNTRILQGTQVQSEIMENMLYARLVHSKRKLFFIGKNYTNETIIRIVQPNGTVNKMKLNETVENDLGEYVLANSIEDIIKYDVVLKVEQAFNSVRQLQMQMFSEVAKSIAAPPELVWETMLSLSDIPNKKDILLKFQAKQAQTQAEQAQMAEAQVAQGMQ